MRPGNRPSTYNGCDELVATGPVPTGPPRRRLPKYNPEPEEDLLSTGLQHVCVQMSDAFKDRGLAGIVQWIDNAGRLSNPTKPDQDRLDACLCLLVALHLAEGSECLMVGDMQSGYIVVPCSAELHGELDARCVETGRVPSKWEVGKGVPPTGVNRRPARNHLTRCLFGSMSQRLIRFAFCRCLTSPRPGFRFVVPSQRTSSAGRASVCRTCGSTCGTGATRIGLRRGYSTPPGLTEVARLPVSPIHPWQGPPVDFRFEHSVKDPELKKSCRSRGEFFLRAGVLEISKM